jgi:hypothetical protein
VDLQASVDVELRTKLAVQSAKDLTEPHVVKFRQENGETDLDVGALFCMALGGMLWRLARRRDDIRPSPPKHADHATT